MKRGDNMTVGVALLLLGVLFLVCAKCGDDIVRKARAQDLAPWFKSLKDAKGQSCCDISDGRILKSSEFRATERGWQAVVNGAWVDVPADKVLERTTNPTGSAVIFYNATGHIYCFVRPVEF